MPDAKRGKDDKRPGLAGDVDSNVFCECFAVSNSSERRGERVYRDVMAEQR